MSVCGGARGRRRHRSPRSPTRRGPRAWENARIGCVRRSQRQQSRTTTVPALAPLRITRRPREEHERSLKSVMSLPEIDAAFYFDLGSPLAYLAAEQVEALRVRQRAREHGLHEPVVAGGLHGNGASAAPVCRRCGCRQDRNNVSLTTRSGCPAPRPCRPGRARPNDRPPPPSRTVGLTITSVAPKYARRT